MSLEIPWDTLRSIIGGLSAVDVPKLNLRSLDEARQFVGCYGFDLSRPEHVEETDQIRVDALALIAEELLDEREELLPEVAECEDICTLLLWASEDERTPRQLWSCAVLRVMHTLAHTHSFFNDEFGPEIRRQILARFEAHFSMDDRGLRLGRGEHAIELFDFEIKGKKERRSIAMKLLHKVENVAEDIFDRIGVRFVTRNRIDSVWVVKYLRENNVIMFANVKPSRSRNTLIDIDWLVQEIDQLRARVASGELTERRARKLLEERVQLRPFPKPPHPSYNPYSALQYHSIQFTCRQMIRVDVSKLDSPSTEARFFFPFEIQILDDESFRHTRSGAASHEHYKARQRAAVRRRVLGVLDRP